MTHIPLHTTPDQLDAYAAAAFRVLNSLTVDIDMYRESNAKERRAWPSSDVRNHELRERLDIESWSASTTQHLRDLFYLLAVGDNGSTVVADVDPFGSSKQAHSDRRAKALARLRESGFDV